MNGNPATAAADLAKLLLFSGLLVAGAAWEPGWGQDRNRDRGSYGSYGNPVERPTLPTPGVARSRRNDAAIDQQPPAADTFAAAQPVLQEAVADTDAGEPATRAGEPQPSGSADPVLSGPAQ